MPRNGERSHTRGVCSCGYKHWYNGVEYDWVLDLFNAPGIDTNIAFNVDDDPVVAVQKWAERTGCRDETALHRLANVMLEAIQNAQPLDESGERPPPGTDTSFPQIQFPGDQPKKPENLEEALFEKLKRVYNQSDRGQQECDEAVQTLERLVKNLLDSNFNTARFWQVPLRLEKIARLWNHPHMKDLMKELGWKEADGSLIWEPLEKNQTKNRAFAVVLNKIKANPILKPL